MRLPIALAAVALLSGCGTAVTSQQQAAVSQIITGAQTLAQAAPAGSTAAQLVQDGALLCGGAVSPNGVLIGAGIVAAASLAGTGPVTVVGALQQDVLATCKALGKVPGALPGTVDPAVVPVVPVATVLKAVS